MAATPERERVTRLTDRREPDSVKIARLEGTVGGIANDVAEIKAIQSTFIERMDHRVSYLEDVRVRGLEEREIARKAIAEERARAADAAQAAAKRAAEAAAAHEHTRLSRFQFWVGTLAICAVTLLGALIASGRIF